MSDIILKIKIYFADDNIMSVLKSSSNVPSTDGAQLALIRKLIVLAEDITDAEIFLDGNGRPRVVTEKELCVKNIKEFSMLDGYRENLKVLNKQEAMEMRNAITNSSKDVMRR